MPAHAGSPTSWSATARALSLLLALGAAWLLCVVVALPHHSLVAPVVKPKPPEKLLSVRVAAIQCPSQMGKLAQNRQRLTELITRAAKDGAKIVVLPECAVHGYYDPLEDTRWSSASAPGENEMAVEGVAEHIPGPSTRYFGALAQRLAIYLTVPLIEADQGRYYNAVVLVGPDGAILAQHRKHNLWTPGDGSWATAGTGAPQVVSTPYGRLGLMICYDVHTMPQRLRGNCDIVLYSVGWYGPNAENWYGEIFPQNYVKPNGFAVVAANWSAEFSDDLWQGVGYSTVFKHDGTVLSMSKRTSGNAIISAELPVVRSTIEPRKPVSTRIQDE
jgi:predicted amidohydrolase